MHEIDVSQLNEMPKESYAFIDIRDAGSVLYGVISGAVNIPAEELERNAEACLEKIDKAKKLIIYCQRGRESVRVTELLEQYDRECYSLKGGYNA